MDKLPPELINMILGYLNIREIGICLDTHPIFNVINSNTKYKIKLSRETLFIDTYSRHNRAISSIHTTLKNAVKDIIKIVFDNGRIIGYHWSDCLKSTKYYRDAGGYRQFIYQCTQIPTLESSKQWMVKRIDMRNVDTATKSLAYEFKNLDCGFDLKWSMNIAETTVNM